MSLLTQAPPARLDLVSTAWPPFTNAPGRPRFALDLVEAALARVGVTATTAIVAAAEFTPALLSGRFDGSAAAWKDAERERTLIFSNPYLENRLVLIGRRGTDVSAKSIADLQGKRVAIVEGYSYGEAVNEAGTTFVRSQSEEDSLARLLSGDADYTLMDDLVVQYIVSNYPKESGSRLQIGAAPIVTRRDPGAGEHGNPLGSGELLFYNPKIRTGRHFRTPYSGCVAAQPHAIVRPVSHATMRTRA
jgi:polar amino acid transport system substrate-binding protein